MQNDKETKCEHTNGYYEKHGNEFCIDCHDYYKPSSTPTELQKEYDTYDPHSSTCGTQLGYSCTCTAESSTPTWEEEYGQRFSELFDVSGVTEWKDGKFVSDEVKSFIRKVESAAIERTLAVCCDGCKNKINQSNGRNSNI